MRSHSSCGTALRRGRCLLLCAAFVSELGFGAPVVAVQPSPVTVSAGQGFSLDVTIAGVADLFAFQFDLGFDPTKLRALAVSEGPFLGTGGATFFIRGTIDNAGGRVQASFDSLVGPVRGVNGSGVLASFSFQALWAGPVSVNPINISLLDSTLFGIPATAQNGTLDVSANQAPEPSALAGFVGIVCLLVTLAVRPVRRRT